MTAQEILKLLLSRHAEDICVPECKDGPTWNRTHRRLDLWVLRRSWSPVTMTGYEIKISRSDFVKDDKWYEYLPTCNQFYFVCPYKLIEPSEIGDEAGLIWTSKKATRLYIKKKAPRREIEEPVDLLLYILIARTKIIEPNQMRIDNSSVTYWKYWLERKSQNLTLGYAVAKRIREHVGEVESENARLKRGIEEFEEIKKRMRELGLDPDKSVNVYSVERQLRELSALFPRDTRETIKEAHRAIGLLLKKVEESSEEKDK